MKLHLINRGQRKPAVVAVQAVVLLGVIFGVAALTIDLGMLFNVRGDLQRTADAAALAAAEAMTNGDPEMDRVARARLAANEYVARNKVWGDSLALSESDIVFGRSGFNESANVYTFTPDNLAPDAVQVTVRRTTNSPNGSVPLLFARIFGQHYSDVWASATSVISPRDMSVVVDLSGSTNYDSQLQHAEITEVNIFDVWAALPGGYNEVDSDWTDEDIDPGWENIEGFVPQAAGPAWGYLKELGFGEQVVDASYDPTADDGLIRLSRYATWNDADLDASLQARGYSAAEIDAIFANSYDNNGGYDERVAVALGFAEWTSGFNGGFGDNNGLPGGDADNRLESSELTWTQSVMGRPISESSDIFSDYINNYVAASNSKMALADPNYRYQFGAKTFTDYLLARRRTAAQTPELSGTPMEPLQSIKDAVLYMSDLFTEIDSNDQLSLEIYASTGRHELNLSHDFDAVSARLSELQAGHYDGNTNLGAGIEQAIAELSSDRGRDTARKVLVLLTDGNANVNEYGSVTVSGGAAYALSAAEQAAALNYRIFAVTVGADANQQLMQEIAAITGGEHFHAAGSIEQYRSQLLGIFLEIGSKRQAQLIF